MYLNLCKCSGTRCSNCCSTKSYACTNVHNSWIPLTLPLLSSKVVGRLFLLLCTWGVLCNAQMQMSFGLSSWVRRWQISNGNRLPLPNALECICIPLSGTWHANAFLCSPFLWTLKCIRDLVNRNKCIWVPQLKGIRVLVKNENALHAFIYIWGRAKWA